MDAGQFGFGVVLIVVGASVFAMRAAIAREIHRYYNSIPDPAWRPRWLPMQFRPTPTQARIVVGVATLALIAIGVSVVLSAVL